MQASYHGAYAWRRHAAPAVYMLLLTLLLATPLLAAPTFSVTELMNHAIVQNPELGVARARAEAADARVRPAGALEDPMLELGIINAALPFSVSREEMTMEMIGLSQRLPYPGKRKLREEVASGDALALHASATDLRDQVLRQIRVAYEELAASVTERRILDGMQAALSEYITVAEARYATGKGEQTDVLSLQTQLGELHRRRLQLEQKQTEMFAELAHLAGHEQSEAFEVAGQSIASSPPPLPALFEMMRVRPRAASIEAERSRAESQLALMRREFYPDFDVKLSYGRREEDPTGMPRDDTVSVSVAVKLPIWRRRKLDPQVAEARAMLSEREQMLRAVNHETRSQLVQKHGAAEQARKSVELFDTVLMPSAEAAVRTALASYRVGKVQFPTLIEARIRLFEAQIARVAAVTAYNTAIAEIDYLAGRLPTGLENLP